MDSPLLFLLPPPWREPFMTLVVPGLLYLLLTVMVLRACLRLFRWAVWGSLQLQGRVALVTGAGSGIGRELVLQLAQQGCKVVLVDIRPQLLASAKRHLVVTHSIPEEHVVTAQCDVSDKASVRRMAVAVQKAVAPQHVSVLINNAGVVMGKPFLELTEAQIERTMGVNCLAHFWVTRQFLPEMVQRDDGVIVGMSSLMGIMAGASLSDYCASKWAINGLLESIRLEMRRCRKWGVSTLTVCPFAVNTGMFTGIFRSPSSDSFIRRFLFPFLSPQGVAAEVVKSLQRRDALLVLPWALRYIPFIARLFPVGLYDWAVELMAGCHGMDDFKGRGHAWSMGAQGAVASSCKPEKAQR